jgi:AraC-like DNA-binding protein
MVRQRTQYRCPKSSQSANRASNHCACRYRSKKEEQVELRIALGRMKVRLQVEDVIGCDAGEVEIFRQRQQERYCQCPRNLFPAQRRGVFPEMLLSNNLTMPLVSMAKTCQQNDSEKRSGGKPCQTLPSSEQDNESNQERPVRYHREGRSGAVMRLIQYEIKLLPELPLSLPSPTDKALARLCRDFLLRPVMTDSIDDWARWLHLSRRTFTRSFRRETGLSFVAWLQQACILAALPKLAAGGSVTCTALDLGYENPTAFTAMFKRILGTSPRRYTAAIGREQIPSETEKNIGLRVKSELIND